jgi:hypothetical protein
MGARLSKADREEFVRQLARANEYNGTRRSAHQISMDAESLIEKARKHHKRCEDMCNYDTGPRFEANTEKLENEIAALAAPYTRDVRFGGDPRGFTVKFFFPQGTYNSWGGPENGWGI